MLCVYCNTEVRKLTANLICDSCLNSAITRCSFCFKAEYTNDCYFVNFQKGHEQYFVAYCPTCATNKYNENINNIK